MTVTFGVNELPLLPPPEGDYLDKYYIAVESLNNGITSFINRSTINQKTEVFNFTVYTTNDSGALPFLYARRKEPFRIRTDENTLLDPWFECANFKVKFLSEIIIELTLELKQVYRRF